MRRRGCLPRWTIAKDEATCVVFGMRGEAIASGAADQVLALPQIANGILTARRAHTSHRMRRVAWFSGCQGMRSH
ncbi:MAG TPA: chemotaxis protein CheB [Bryobacteraceae bacterium]|nr:chemotaxis protein CheB [Bryobacteraceae bacterium]